MSKTIEFIEKEIKEMEATKRDISIWNVGIETKKYLKDKLQTLQQIKTELEAWEVVKNKSVDIHDVIHCSLEVFNRDLYEKYQLTEEEYNKIKKALEVEDE